MAGMAKTVGDYIKDHGQYLADNFCDCDENYTCTMHKWFPDAPMPSPKDTP